VEGPALDGLADATEAVTLIEAPDPRIEALCIALSLRRAAEEGTRAILVTPDRTLARRVAAALDRWGIVPDDSAGEPLALSPTGRLLRQMARSFGTRPNAADLLALLKHPLAASGGGDRGPHLLFLREIELKLRRHGPAFPTGADVTAWASQLALPGIGPWADWLAALIDGLWLSGERELSSALDTHIAITTRLAAGPEGDVSALWQGADGSAARGIFDALAREAHLGGKVTPAAYSALVDSLLATEGVRTSTGAHPLVAIRGTLDARAGGGDLVILGGLNDGIWPPAPPPDPWLSRGMRAAMGFRSPERRIGLSAHDFQQAIAAPRIILTRAIRDSQTDTVPSRWLARLIHLLDGLPDTGGRAALTAMRARGNDLIRLARSIDAAPAVPAPARRPAPIPPPAARPLTLSLTDVPRLLLDPYEVYARRILRLSRLNPLRPEPSPRHLGEVMHQVLDRFISNRPADETADAALARLLGLAGTALDAEIPWPADRRIWRARFARAAGPLAGREADRADGRTSVTERKTSAALPPTGVTLAFRPDRIDAKPDGTIAVYDYKSTLHSGKRAEIDALQLQLAAHLVALGAFPDIKGAVTEAAFISYKDGEERAVDVAQADIAKALASVEPILRAYTSDLPFTALARPYGHNPDRPWDYDLLARHGEWELGDPPDIRPVP
jgi:RecB family exonuclease